MIDHQFPELSSRAYGWRLERRDGVTIGFTSHDRDIELDGLLYRASPGMEPTSIVQNEGLDPGGLDVNGALSSASIREDDLRAGRWNRAAVQIFLFDWEQPDAGKILLAAGELGGISWSGDAFEAELLGLADKLGAPIVPATSPGCRAQFCDNDCGLSLRRFQHDRRTAAIDGRRVQLQSSTSFPPGALKFGSLRFLSGPLTGLSYNIADHSIVDGVDEIILAESTGMQSGVSARAILTEGCDKVLTTCVARFGNAVNFRGEAFLPGNDLLTRYPGAN